MLRYLSTVVDDEDYCFKLLHSTNKQKDLYEILSFISQFIFRNRDAIYLKGEET